MKIFQILSFFVVLTFFPTSVVFAAEEKPFQLKMDFDLSTQILLVDVIRDALNPGLSPQRIIFSRNDEFVKDLSTDHTRIEEEIIAEEGDILKVELFYGEGLSIARQIEAKVKVLDSSEKENKRSYSVLVQDDVNYEAGNEGVRMRYNRIPERKFGYEKEGNQHYGQKGFGYEVERRVVGYTDPGEEASEESFGYKDGFGYQGDDQSYGEKLDAYDAEQ